MLNILTDLFSFHLAAPGFLCFILDSLEHKGLERMGRRSTGSVLSSTLPPVGPSTINLLGSQGTVLG